MSKSYGRISIGVGFVLLFVGALDIRGHYGIWAASSILFGLFLIVLGASFFVSGERQRFRRRISFGFLGAAVVLLAIAIATTS